MLSDPIPQPEKKSVAWQAWYNREGWKIERDAILSVKASNIIKVSNKLAITLEEAASLLDANNDAIRLAESKLSDSES